jgi:hypothetical protein
MAVGAMSGGQAAHYIATSQMRLSSFGRALFLALGGTAGIIVAFCILKTTERERTELHRNHSVVSLGFYSAIYGCIAGVLIMAIFQCAFITMPLDLLNVLTD